MDLTRILRTSVYGELARTGRAPTVAELSAEHDRGANEIRRGLEELHRVHELVLGPDGEVRMALPFSAIPTEHVVESGGIRYWANCAWDTLGIPVALGRDATIRSLWSADDEPLTLVVRDGDLRPVDGRVHFAVPAARWWDDIVET